MNVFKRLWIAITYWKVPCEDCNGTGLCHHKNSRFPHSCCGDCGRKRVPWSAVPSNFDRDTTRFSDTAIIGDGTMYRRP